MLKAEMEAFASEWIAVWNARDLERILSHYSSGIEFSFVAKVVDESSGQLRGKDALRTYWAKAFERLPALRFKLITVSCGLNSVILNYELEDGRLATEWFEFGPDRKVVRSAAHYGP